MIDLYLTAVNLPGFVARSARRHRDSIESGVLLFLAFCGIVGLVSAALVLLAG